MTCHPGRRWYFEVTNNSFATNANHATQFLVRDMAEAVATLMGSNVKVLKVRTVTQEGKRVVVQRERDQPQKEPW